MDQFQSKRGEDVSTSLGPQDETLDGLSVSDLSASDMSGANENPSVGGAAVRLVEGSGPQISSETFGVLRVRLRIASLVLFMAFVVFTLWNFLAVSLGMLPMVRQGVFYGQISVIFLLGLCAWSLYRKSNLSGRSLRLAELVVFGVPGTFFFATQFNMMRMCAVEENFLPHPDVPWLILIFTYALFIPNTWRRAAVVVGAMACAPIFMTVVLWLTDQVCAELISEGWWSMVMMGLTMVVSAICAVIGVYTINSLRVEAFEARRLGQYRLGRLLGGGGMGEVYLAEHQLMKRPCAIKVVRPEKAGDPRTLARFEQEVRETAKLSHWNSIDIFDYGRADDGTFFYVMEYLPGLSLSELVEQHGPLPPERVIFLLCQTCDALSEAHGHGLIHRDIKPANIIAAQRGGRFDVAKLLDFGMVKRFGDGESLELTHDGVITGSPLFLSPEQATGEREPDARSDVYSLGAVAYYLLSGRPPFEGRHVVDVLVAHASKTPQPLVKTVPDTPADLAAVVMRCLEKKPEDRFDSADALHIALESCEASGRWSFARAGKWWADREG